MNNHHKGLFITFEGGEGAGKSTLIEGIYTTLAQEGRPVIKAREPGGTELGEHIRDLLLHKKHMSPYAELCLFLASRAQQINEVIGPALREHKIVLCDRFNDSSVAYQGAARGLGMEPVAAFCDFISQGLVPHLTFYLDISPDIGLARAQNSRTKDRIEAEKLSFHEKIREAYHLLHRQHPHRLHLLDATQPPQQVLAQALSLIRTRYA
jgi:dTMP kinase